MSSSKERQAQKVNKVNEIFKAIQAKDSRLKSAIDSIKIEIENENESDARKKLSEIDLLTNEINKTKAELEKLCIESFSIHMETASNLNIDSNHWRSCYYNLIETLRKESNFLNQFIRSNSSRSSENLIKLKDVLVKLLEEVLDDGFRFFSKFIEFIERTFIKFKAIYFIHLNDHNYLLENMDEIKQFDDLTRNASNGSLNLVIKSKDMKFALMCIHRSWIAMGDLARYKETIAPSSDSVETNEMQVRDYSLSRFYYLKAKAIAPKSPRAYHQLAIIAVYTKRRLDAVYYYFRCLEANVPLLNVRQSLNSIFEECRSKSDSLITEMKRSISNRTKSKQAKSQSKQSWKNRKEIWHKPEAFCKKSTQSANIEHNCIDAESSEDDDTVLRYDDTNCDRKRTNETTRMNVDSIDYNRLNEKKLGINELNKRFMLNYLSTIGKLFTKVGMETYKELSELMLNEFNELLLREPCPFGKMRLLQICAVNISLVDLIHKSVDKSQSVSSTEQLEYVLQLSLDMFSLIVKQFNKSLRNTSVESAELAENMFSELLPSIKIFIDWMQCNVALWRSAFDSSPIGLVCVKNRSDILLDMLNSTHQLESQLEICTDNSWMNNYLTNVKLEEDFEMAGFSPFSTLPRGDYDFEITDLDLEMATHLNQNMISKAKSLKRVKKIRSFGEHLCTIVNPFLEYDPIGKCFRRTKENEQLLSKDTSTSNKTSFESTNHLSNNLTRLEINDEDESVVDEQETRDDLVKSNSQPRIQIEIKPKFIVLDTNCFIDYLELIDKLLTTCCFVIFVPLLVINELEKLTKASYGEDSTERAEYLQHNAKKSLIYLAEKFSKRERCLKALTSQGSALDSMQFRTEDIKEKGITDDLILGCCLHYCKDTVTNPDTDFVQLVREVVLLTEDRNLSLKAHTKNVPVTKIVRFCKWLNLV